VTQQDLSSPAHRLENISKGLLFKAYATVFALAMNPDNAGGDLEALRPLFHTMNMELARTFDVATTAWESALWAAGDPYGDHKDGQDQAE